MNRLNPASPRAPEARSYPPHWGKPKKVSPGDNKKEWRECNLWATKWGSPLLLEEMMWRLLPDSYVLGIVM